jgi:Leucine-rich repeat (LRR) protein
MTKVTWVVLRNCNVQSSDLVALRGMTDLAELRISGNALTDVTELGSLTKLAVLEMKNNQVSDLSPFRNHPALKNLWVDANQLTSQGTAALLDVPTLAHLSIYYNPIACNDSVLDTLRARGVNVLCQ